MTSFYLKEAQNLNFAVAVSEEFLSALKGFREREAGFTEYMPEDFWFIGHYQPGDHVPVDSLDVEDPNKLSNAALKRWWNYHEKWKALSREQLDALHAKGEDFKVYDKIGVKISKLLAERYAEFPNDRVGFLAHLDFVTDRRVKIKELLAAAEKWPSDIDIIETLYSTLSEDDELPPDVILAPITAFVDVLPSMSEVEKLTGSKFAPGRYRIEGITGARIRLILNIVDHTLRGIREREKTAWIRATLEKKGWKAKGEVSGH
jgi:hypothetical protein